MTADVRTAARDEAFNNHYSHKQVPDRYDADLLIAGFMDGAEFWAARVAPTREQIQAVIEEALAEFPNETHDYTRSWADQEAEAVTKAVVAVMAGLPAGES